MERVARTATRRTRLLLELSEAFAVAQSVDDVAEQLAAIVGTIGARYAGLALLDAAGTRLTYTSLDHLEPGLPRTFRRIRLEEERGAAAAARSDVPLFFRDHAAFAEAFPEAADLIGDDGVEARSFLPVASGGGNSRCQRALPAGSRVTTKAVAWACSMLSKGVVNWPVY